MHLVAISLVLFALLGMPGCASDPTAPCKNASAKACWSYPEEARTAFERDWRRCQRQARARAPGDPLRRQRFQEICLQNEGYVFDPSSEAE